MLSTSPTTPSAQRCKCKECGVRHTMNPKRRTYPKEIREQVIKMYYDGISVRGIGKILKTNHTNVINWIKKAF